MKRRSILALCAAVALMGAACGDPAPSETDREETRDISDQIALAGDKARDEGSVKIVSATTMELPEAAGGGEITMAGRGVMQFDPQIGEMEMVAAGKEGLAKQTAQAMGRTEMVMEGLVIYMKSPLYASMLGSDKWLKMDLQAVGEELGIDLSQLAQTTGGTDPSGGLNYFMGARDVEEVGTEEIRGESTTHYRGVVDLEEIPEDVIPSDQIDKLIELTGSQEFPLEVWIAEDDLPARVIYEFDYSNSDMAATAAMGKMEMTLEYVEWGVPVDVEVPPASDTIDMVQLIKEKGGSLGSG